MLYTGKGDGGTTKAFDSKERISKSSELPEALGSLDELNSFLGFARATADDAEIRTILHDTQETLFVLQAEVAGAEKKVGEDQVKKVEAIVNRFEQEIPPLKGFSIAGGTELSALLDVARTIARRTERRLIAAEAAGRELSPAAKAYANRLSSLLFALARVANHRAGVAEENPKY